MRTSHLGALVFAIGVLATLAFSRPAAAGTDFVAGAVEDDLRASTLVEAETRMALMRVSGFRAVRVTSYWQPGDTRPTEGEILKPCPLNPAATIRDSIGVVEITGLKSGVTS